MASVDCADDLTAIVTAPADDAKGPYNMQALILLPSAAD